MTGRGTIVVGVDGSADARRALDWAVMEARCRRNVVLAVHAWTLGPVADFVWRPRRALRRDSVALLKATIRNAVRLGAEVEFDWSSVEGEAASVLLDAARAAEMLVLAAHRGTAPACRSLGSVARTCLREATVPVVIIPAALLRNGPIECSAVTRPNRNSVVWPSTSMAASHATWANSVPGSPQRGLAGRRTVNSHDDIAVHGSVLSGRRPEVPVRTLPRE